MCRPNSCVHSSAEEATAAEESLLVYCKPVELYNIIHRRAIRNPLFLQRCLSYKIQARRRRRLQLTVSLREGVQEQFILPLHILLAKPISDTAVVGHIAEYNLIRACMLSSFTEIKGKQQADANLILPDMNKLSLDVKAGKLTILLVSSVSGGTEKILREGNVGGHCLWGKIPMESLCLSLEKCVNLMWGHRVELLSNVDMRSCFLQPCRLEEGSSITFQTRLNSESMDFQQQVQINISVKVAGAHEKSPYDSFACKNVPISTLSDIIRLRSGNVIFNYRDLNNMSRKTEVTEDFSCPFCLVQCSSFKGLRYHLLSSHDLFNFEFWVTEEYQAVNVSVKTDILRSQNIADGVDPRLLTFSFCSQSRKHRKRKDPVQKLKHVFPLSLGPGLPRSNSEGTSNKNEGEKAPRKSFPDQKGMQNGRQAENCDLDIHNVTDSIEHVASSFNNMGVSIPMPQSSTIPEFVRSVSGKDPFVPNMLPCTKSKKLSLERSDSRNRMLLQKRQFFHSHRAQPMALDEVVSEKDSEDEIDDDIADFEDQRMLDDFVDVTKDEKHLMHLWNSFVRKQRVLADGHVPWACEAFSKLHSEDLVRAPALFWCWRLFMIKLWNHGLVDARTMNNCNIILETEMPRKPEDC